MNNANSINELRKVYSQSNFNIVSKLKQGVTIQYVMLDDCTP